jgi:two-component system NtrC family sensor kinase
MELPGIPRYPIDWHSHISHRSSLPEDITLENAYETLLQAGVDFAVVIGSRGETRALASINRIASVLSAKYGQALYSNRSIGHIRVPLKILGTAHAQTPDTYLPVVTPIAEAMVLGRQHDFFAAQRMFERRRAEQYFDDIVIVDENSRYVGLMTVLEFNRIQAEVVTSQQNELTKHNRMLEETLAKLSTAQGELVSQAKMASLGELVAGIAHEMNTPLGVLLSSHDVFDKAFRQLDAPGGTANYERLHVIIRKNLNLGQQASQRVSQILQSLRIFARGDTDVPHESDLADLIESSLVLLSNKFKHRVQVHLSLEPNARLTGYPGQLSQVFLNILTNAYQAMNGAGKIFISLKPEENAWRLTIRDTGPGIPPHQLDRIFDPGFTTKGVGVGTGLGLSISRKIVELHHGGKLTATNSPEGGAIFSIFLPAFVKSCPMVYDTELLTPA